MLPNARTVLLRVSAARDARLSGIPGQWIYVGGEARSGFSAAFDAAEQVIVAHNLGRRPSNVSVYTHGGVSVEVFHQHLDINRVLLNFDVPIAGTVEIS